MSGDANLGAVLRELRTVRGLTLATVARHAGCTEGLLSYIESGKRQLYPWLAEKLDQIYVTGNAVASLARGISDKPSEESVCAGRRSDVFVVLLPQGGAAMPLSRRQVLAALGVGIVSDGLQAEFERALDTIELNDDILQFLEEAYSGFKEAAHMLPPAQLIDGMTGTVAVLDGLRRRAAVGEDKKRCSKLQARYADLLSWLSQEAGDLSGSMWWIDRATQWAQAAGWLGITAWSFIRRTSMAHSFSGDGLRVVDQALPVLDMPIASPRMKGLAAGQIAYGYAMAGNRDASNRALDTAMSWFVQPVREDDTVLGQRAVPNDDLFAVHQATCEIYLGHGARIIPALETLTDSLVGISLRMATVTQAKLARAYANAGQPDKACLVAWDALDAMDQVDSQFARSELRRALPVLNQWHGRSEVQDVVHRLQASPACVRER